jgi:hypothetical protein
MVERGGVGEGGSPAVNEPFTPTCQYSRQIGVDVGIGVMRSVRNWAGASGIAALVLLSPVLAFMMVIAAEVLIEAGMTGVSAAAIGVVGCMLFRRILRLETAREAGSDEVCAAPPVGAPPG